MSDNTKVKMKTTEGELVIELFDDDAPETVKNFLKYAEDGFFKGSIFHRVIPNFVVQGGGFKPGMIQKDTTYGPVKNEAEKSGHRNKEGTVAMARTGKPHSATSQFYINLKDNDGLDWDRTGDGWGYCVFGKVVDGMDVVEKIGDVDTLKERGHADVPAKDIKIKEVEVL